jgi:hypothetical protein
MARRGSYTISMTVRDEDGGVSAVKAGHSSSSRGRRSARVTPSDWWTPRRANGSSTTMPATHLTNYYFGNPGDIPFMGDWNGNGIETPGLYRQSDGFVYLRNTNTQGPADIRFFFGESR